MNFPNFPLYQSLKKQCENEFKELNSDQKDKFLEFIKDICTAEDEREGIVLAMIRAYHLDNDMNIEELPYGGKKLKGGIKYDFECLPSKLQYMLYTFSNIK